MGRLQHLGLKAEENKMYGIALQSEIARGKVAGYYVERRAILTNKSIDDMNLEELYEKMKEIEEKNKHFINVKEDKKDEKK